MVAVSACMSGTRGSGVLSSTGDVLEMSVVRGVGGVAGPGIYVLCLVDTCTSEMHPVFNPDAPYGYLLSDMYLFMADITNPDLIV